MITLLENTMTRKKGTMNFIDNRGKVIGFNPYLVDEFKRVRRIPYSIRNRDGKLILDDTIMPVEDWLIGNYYHFGSMYFTPETDGDELIVMEVELIHDHAAHLAKVDFAEVSLELRLAGKGGKYYCEDLSLSADDVKKLFSPEAVYAARRNRKLIAEQIRAFNFCD